MLNEQQTTGMLQFAGLKPDERRAYLEGVVSRNDLGGFGKGRREGRGGRDGGEGRGGMEGRDGGEGWRGGEGRGGEGGQQE
jgi:hypothetical protein